MRKCGRCENEAGLLCFGGISDLDEALILQLFQKAEQVSFAAIRLDLVFGDERPANILNGTRLLQKVPNAGTYRV